MTAIHDPGGLGFRIERLWAFLAVHDDGDEGVMGATIAGTLMPLVAADETRVEELRAYAAQVALATGKRVVLARFDRRTDEEVWT